MLNSLNGAIIGLLVDTDVRALEPHEASELIAPRVLRRLPLAPCVGLGIIRSIDVVHKQFFVLSPVPVALLRTVNVFVRGAVHLPGILMYQVRRACLCCTCCDFAARRAVRAGRATGGAIHCWRPHPCQLSWRRDNENSHNTETAEADAKLKQMLYEKNMSALWCQATRSPSGSKSCSIASVCTVEKLAVPSTPATPWIDSTPPG